MKIAIISDSHDNIPNIEKFLAWEEKNPVELLIHCGDVAAPGMVKKIFGPRFKKPMHFIHGNVADRELMEKVCQEFDQITHHQDEGNIEIDGIKIAFNHYPNEAEDLARTGRYDFVFYGHDHKPWEKHIGNTTLINPGTLAGMFNRATFAIFDTQLKKAELILVEKI
jgi:putative phosphoesterase